MTHLLVFEPIPRNAALLARLADVELQEVRSITQLKQAIRQSPPQIVAIEIEPVGQAGSADDFAERISLIHWLKTICPQCVVIAMPTMAVCHETCWLYESGVDLIFRSMLDRDLATKLMQRASQDALNGNLADLPLAQQIQASLPWKKHAS